ncbi:MAG: 4Fe-4S dicluster domain-containing protein [Oscillospiraceae bacterium]|nr:4Fe-4S dicluster domain-containing protein [Oscillospiraceae bacterium]
MMQLQQQVQQAGVVGCGGAGFPTHVKLAAQGVDTLVINGAECEPLLRTDRYLMREHAAAIIAATAAAKEQLGAAQACIALKESYHAEIAALQQAIDALAAPVELFLLKSFYPAGDEQVQVYEVTGRVVPPGGIPLDVGCVVSNVATMFAVHHAMHGRPFTQKYLTITGAVASPCVIKAPLGTSFADCLALAGGALVDDFMVVSGGPMMGKAMTKEQAMQTHVSKTTSGFLVLPPRTRLWQIAQLSTTHIRNRARAACIQCSFCTQLCPRWLLGHPIEPHKIMRRTAGGQAIEALLDDPVVRAAQYCCECGVCELYACPMELNPRRINALIKQACQQQGLRAEKGETNLQAREYRADRRIPTQKAAMRAGVGKWYNTEPTLFVQAQPTEVYIALNAHIGAPAQSIVQVGQQVTLGQCIAMTPTDKLGVDYHASIAGEVIHVGETVIIRKVGN